MEDKKSLRWLRQAADEGNALAQFKLGLQYAYGRDIHPNDTEAVKWWKRAAINKSANAQYCLGVMYESGRGVEPDARLANQYFERAYARGFRPGRNTRQSIKRDPGAKVYIRKTI